VLDHMEQECSLHLAREPRFPACARGLGVVFSKINDFDRARHWLGVYLSYPHPPDAEAERAYAAMAPR